MFFQQRKVPALLKAKATIEDSVSISLVKGPKEGYMVKDEFDNDLSNSTVKVFPTMSTAKSYAQDQEVVKVSISCTILR